MGTSSSATRKLTVENDDPTSVIKVSEEVVDRLKGNQVVRNENLRQQAPVPPPQGGNFPIFWNEPNLTSYQLRQANVAELKKNDDYWQHRLKNLEEKHKKMNETLDHEYKKAMEEISSSKFGESRKNLPPCKDTERAVMECYQCNPDEPMRCAKVVLAFQECVDLKRNCLLAGRMLNN